MPEPSRGLLSELAPEAFERWVGDRLREMGYDVRLTPASGDHGADLVATREGASLVVQCKHRPAGVVGEPVLRDLYGAVHHFGAGEGLLVTSGRVSDAARAWIQGKPLTIWGAQELRARWQAEIDAVVAEIGAAGGGEEAGPSGGPSGWYVYTDDHGTPWALKIPREFGDHPSFGFSPFVGPGPARLPKTITPREVTLSAETAKGKRYKRVVVGTRRSPVYAGPATEVEIPGRDGPVTTFRISGYSGERERYDVRALVQA